MEITIIVSKQCFFGYGLEYSVGATLDFFSPSHAQIVRQDEQNRGHFVEGHFRKKILECIHFFIDCWRSEFLHSISAQMFSLFFLNRYPSI